MSSLRDQFAMAAMQGILSGSKYVASVQVLSERAYMVADAMMKEREKVHTQYRQTIPPKQP